MGLLNFFKPANKMIQQPTQSIVERAEPDNYKTQLVADFLKIPKDKRDNKWRKEFYQEVKTAAFECGEPKIITGPDEFQYLVLQVPEAGKSFEPLCIQNLKDELLERGLGIVIDPKADNKEWVITHGEIVNLFLNNEFISENENGDIDNIDMTKQLQVIKTGEEVMYAQPSAKFFPKQTRHALKNFLQGKGLQRPMIMLVCRKNTGRSIQQLAFNVFQENFNTKEERDFLMQQICWFFPLHYLIISFDKKSGMTKYFADL